MNARARFQHALRFLTILPAFFVGEGLADARLADYAAFFPAVGIYVGLLSGLVYLAASLAWTGFIPSLLAIIASIAVTAAFHEDGLADTADGFGGGWTREQRLAIMKDSRLGTFGVLGLGLGVACRVFAVSLLAPHFVLWTLIAAHAGARCAMLMVMTKQAYGGDRTASRMQHLSERLDPAILRVAGLWTLAAFLPLLVTLGSVALVGLVLGAALSFALARYSQKAIGGYSGDVLGAVEQLFEIGFLLGVAAIPAATLV
jgi:adenosylcobinamide-GDP ribazoletransferase